jgi:hypothetical protein
MRKNDFLFCRVALALAAVLCLNLIAAAQSQSTLYRFTGGADGANPAAGLVGGGARTVLNAPYVI